MNPDEKKDKVPLMIEEKCGDVLRATAEAERRAYENTIEELHQKLLVEVKARVEAEQALARARTTLRAHAAAKPLDLQRPRQEDGLTSHLRAWEKERQYLTSGRNQAVEALKLSEQALTLATAKLLESGHTAPKPAQLGGEFQLSRLRAEICAAQSAKKTAEVNWNMTRTNLLMLEKNLRAEIAEKDEMIILLSNAKKEVFQVTQKELDAFKAKLMEMARVMTRLQIHSKEKDMQSSQIIKELRDKCAEMESAEKQAADTAEELLSLRKTADQSAADLEALRMTADQSAADLEALQMTADQSAADLEALRMTADQSAADLEALRMTADQSAADLEALRMTADQSAAELEALRKTADQSAADLEALRKTADQSVADLEALQSLSRKQARCQSQETQTEKCIGKKKKKKGCCLARLMFWRKSQHA